MATSFNDYKNPYIESIYEQKRKAAEDALTSAYQQNMANLDTQAEETTAAYDTQRSRLQSSYEQALHNYGEYANASGLNSGAQAQARLAYGAQNQSGMSSLADAEAAALREIGRQRTAAKNEYNADVAANRSAHDTDFYNALYSAWQDQVAQEKQDRDHYYDIAMAAIRTGTMPDSDTLSRAGIDASTAATMAAYYRGGLSGSTPDTEEIGETLTKEIGETLTKPHEPTPTDSDYAAHLIGPATGAGAYNTVSNYINSGNLTAANSALAMYSTLLTTTQYNQLLSRINSAANTGSGGGGKFTAMTR